MLSGQNVPFPDFKRYRLVILQCRQVETPNFSDSYKLKLSQMYLCTNF